MVELKNPRTARIQKLLVAFVSWFCVFFLAGLPFFASGTYLFGGLFLSVVIWLAVMIASLALNCPNCGKNITVNFSAPAPARLAPDWNAARKQFFPVEAIVGKPGCIVCPHCGVDVSIKFGV